MDPRALDRLRLHPVDPAVAARQQAQQVAQQFEEVFVRSMVGTLRQSAQLGDDGGGMFGSGPGADTYGDWFDQHLAHQVSSTGKVGVATVLMREFERWHQIPPAPPAPTTPPSHDHRPGKHVVRAVRDAAHTAHSGQAARAAPTKNHKGGIDVAA